MSSLKVHFSFEPDKPEIETFANTLIADFGQEDFGDADTIVTIGGDGSLLHAFGRAAKGQKFFGMVPPSSNSRGFWTNHGISNADMLRDALGAAEAYKITPLQADVQFTDGSSRRVKAFNEFLPSEDSGQSMLAHLTFKHPSTEIGPLRIMGDGLIVATPFGSTAINRIYGGPKINIRNTGIAITGKGLQIQRPEEAGKRDSIIFEPLLESDDVEVVIDFLSAEKRPVRLLYDGKKITSERMNPFSSISIQKDKEESVDLLLVDDPATRVHSAYMKIPFN